MWFRIILAIVAGLLGLWLKRRKEHFRYFQKLGIPGPKPSIISGNLPEMYFKSCMWAMNDWHRKYGPVVGFYFGLEPTLLVADVELLKNILNKDFSNFTDRTEWTLIGGKHSVLALKGKQWKNVRNILSPSYTSSKLKLLVPDITRGVDEFMENVKRESRKGNHEFDIYQYFQALTLETICRTGLGINYNVQKNLDNKVLKFVKANFNLPMSILSVLMLSLPILGSTILNLIASIRVRYNNEGLDPVQELHGECVQMVNARRANKENKRQDLLQMMLDASGEEGGADGCPVGGKLTIQQTVDNAMVVLLAGYETTSSALAYIANMLIRYQDVQERVRQEVLKTTDAGKNFGFDNLENCIYLEAVISETLRMYPPVYMFTTRVANEDKEYDNLKIPKGLSVMCSTREIQYSEEYWPEPERFDPERFMPENKANIVPLSWQPFGAGPRNCVGMRLAMLEIKMTLAKLLTKYKLDTFEYVNTQSKVELEVNPILVRLKNGLTCRAIPLGD